MKSPNRDLLVLLNEMLFHVESMENFCKAHEVIDLNRYKIYLKSKQIIKVVRQREIRPFQFISNKN